MKFGDLLVKMASGKQLDLEEQDQLRLLADQAQSGASKLAGFSSYQSLADNMPIRNVSWVESPLEPLLLRGNITFSTLADKAMDWDVLVRGISDQFYLDQSGVTDVKVVNGSLSYLASGFVSFATAGTGSPNAVIRSYYTDGTTEDYDIFRWDGVTLYQRYSALVITPPDKTLDYFRMILTPGQAAGSAASAEMGLFLV